MSYRSDVDALAARHDALAAEVASKTRELDVATQLLDEARAKARLPVLANIRVATPCRADWNQMTGDDRVRACGACEKNVYNLSEMTRDEAEALILAKEGRLCVRYFQRADGTILLKDCAVGISQKRKRRLIAAGAAALLGGGAFLAYEVTRPDAPKSYGRSVAGGFPTVSVQPLQAPTSEPAPVSEVEGEIIMGDVIAEPPLREVKGGLAPLEEGDLVQQGQVLMVAPK
jgi:hypothetical protein